MSRKAKKRKVNKKSPRKAKSESPRTTQPAESPGGEAVVKAQKPDAEPTPQAGEKVAVAVETQPNAEETEKERQQTPLSIIWTRRERYRHMAVEAMKRCEFEHATTMFEACLSEAESYPLPTDNHARHQLVICRLRGRNHEQNLKKCVEECDYLLEKKSEKQTVTTPGLRKPELTFADPFQFHEGKCDALLRLLDYEQCAKQLLKAVEQDQSERLPSLHLFLNNIAKATQLPTPEQKKRCGFTYPIPKETLKEFFSLLTAPSRQTVLSLQWDQIHDTIDSEMCDSMLGGFHELHKKETCVDGAAPVSVAQLKSFLHKALDSNMASRKIHNEIFFLKQEIAMLVTQNMWEKFPVPAMPPPGTEDIEKVFQSLPMDAPLTYLMENGVYMSRDGMEFVSSALVEGITHLTTLLECSPDDSPSLVVSLAYLTDVGFNVLAEICENGYVNFHALGPESPLWKITDEQWHDFIKLRLKAHEVLEVKAAENLVPPQEANEDPKIFENKLESVVGKQKKEELMKIELRTSLPILKKYAKLMSMISGIDYDTLVKELTEPEDEFLTDEEKREKEERKKNRPPDEPEEEEYVPVGLSVLIQGAEFKLVPHKVVDGYDKEKILEELKKLEKDVVQFQIDYKKQVYEVAGSNKDKLAGVMSNLQNKGMQLTKWLRGFVKYMIDRRDVEQEILDQSGCETVAEAMKRFEDISSAVSAGQSLLLRLICRAMLWNLVQARMKFKDEDLVVPEVEAPATETEPALVPEDVPPGMEPQQPQPGRPGAEAEALAKAQGEPQEPDPLNPPESQDRPARKSTTPSTPDSRGEKEETTDEEHVVEEHAGEERKNRDPEDWAEGNPELPVSLTSLPALLLPKGQGKKIELTGHCLNQAYSEMLAIREVTDPAMTSFSKDIGRETGSELKPKPDAQKSGLEKSGAPVDFKDRARRWMSSWSHNEDMPAKIAKLKEQLGVSKLSVSYLEIDVSIRQIWQFLHTSTRGRMSNFPMLYRGQRAYSKASLPDLQKLSLLIDRNSRETIFHLVVSKVDKQTTLIPTKANSTAAQLNNVTVHPLCHSCGKLFGTMVCSSCGGAHYCGKKCQVAHWKRHCQPCRQMSSFCKELQIFTL